MSSCYLVGLAQAAAADAAPGDRKLLADVVYGAEGGVPRAEVDEQLRWFGIAPTPEEEERIARGETVTFLIAE